MCAINVSDKATKENEKKTSHDFLAEASTVFCSILMCVVKGTNAQEESETSSGAAYLTHTSLEVGSLRVVLAKWSRGIQIENPP